MTKEKLNEIIKLKREVERLRQKLQELNHGDYETVVTDKVKGSMPQYPYSARSFILTGIEHMSEECINQRDVISKKISKKYHELYMIINDVIDYINSIEDSELRTILSYKYIDGLKPIEIGECMGWSGRTIERRLKEWAESCR
jgi:hypothetical protein